ncbi:MAG: hypothetical protein JNM57_03445 [Cyclobacteriaceae bacterium]|nr:hypothetical protein [Cyclobacteriaceae bacterium]
MKYALIIGWITLGIPVFGQLKEDDKSLALTYDYVDFKAFSPKSAIGLTGEYMLGDHFGIEFSVAGGKDYLHFGTGALFAPLALLLSNANTEDSGGGLLILLLGIASLFEHTNYHIPLSEKVELVPYVSLLRFRYIYEEIQPHDVDIFASWSIGTKLSLITKKNWFINATVEGSQLYYSGRPKGIQAGIHIGRIFKSKRE